MGSKRPPRKCLYCRDGVCLPHRSHCGQEACQEACRQQRLALFAARKQRGQQRQWKRGCTPVEVAGFIADHQQRIEQEIECLRAAGLDPLRCSAYAADQVLGAAPKG